MRGSKLNPLIVGLSLLLTSAAVPAWAAAGGTLEESAGSAARPAVLRVAQATAFTWSATKAADGSISLAGNAPSQEIKDSLADNVPNLRADVTKVMEGGPDNFPADAVAALGILADLDSGAVMFDGTAWTISGVVTGADAAATAQAAFDASTLKGEGATYNVVTRSAPAAAASAGGAAPPAPPAASAPAASPAYSWSAAKAEDGTITFAGEVPSERLKAFLTTHVEGKSVDNSTVAEGAPKDFVGGALYGLDALMTLQSGKLEFSDGKWRLTGTGKGADAEKTAREQLGAIDTKTWSFDIKQAPAVAAAPAQPPAPPATAASSDETAPASSAAATAPAAAPDYTFTASKSASGVTLAGDVPTEGARGYFADMAGASSADGLSIVAHPPENFVTNALAGIDALGKLSEGELALSAGKWSLKGKAPTPEARDAVVASLGALPTGKDFAVDVVGPTPVELCNMKLAALGPHGPAINFDGRSTKFAKGTDAELDGVAAALALCPGVRVDVSAYTDSDGAADANMALTVARAEAVIGALVKRGIQADRLYAVGYGETLPLVPNTTKANKAKNRRIEFTIDPKE